MEKYLKEANDLHLLLISDDGEFKYKSSIISLDERLDHNPMQIEKSTSIPPLSKKVVIGVLETPFFSMKSSFTITGVISYRVVDESYAGYHQMNLPCVSLSSTSLVDGALLPLLTNPISVEDLVAVMAVLEKTELEVIIHEKEINLTEVMNKLLYTEIIVLNNVSCFVKNNITPGSLSGSILFWKQSTSGTYSLICHTRNEKQLLLVAHSLLSILPHGSQLLKKTGRKTCLDRAVENLGSELGFLAESLRNGLLPVDGPFPDVCDLQFEGNHWREMRQKLASLELETDLAFQGLSS